MMSDLIRREDAIKAIEELPNAYNGWSDAYDKAYIIGALEEVPSADRPQGEWIKHEHGFWTFVNDRGERDGWLPDYECNLCGSRAWRYATNFCPNCGARLKGADDD
jgi:hypothetical protein